MSRWPFPGDRAVDRARQVALQYRAALHAVDEAACAVIDRAAVAVGEDWVQPKPARFVDHDFISVLDAAELVDRTPKTIYNWVHAGALTSYPEGGKIRVRVADLLRVDAERREATLRTQ